MQNKTVLNYFIIKKTQCCFFSLLLLILIFAGCSIQTIQINHSETLGFKPTVTDIKVYQNHRWAVKDISEQFLISGRSKNGIEIISHKTKPIMATQFHPEVTKDNQGAVILNLFLDRLKHEQ